MSNIKLIATDLDGTLLNSAKEIPKENIEALKKAYEKGIVIVPSTGRHFWGIPEELRNLNFVEYISTLNGANVLNKYTLESFYGARIKKETAIEIIQFLQARGYHIAIHIDDREYVEQSSYDKLYDIVPSIIADYLKVHAKPVNSIVELINEIGSDVQKFQYYCYNKEEKDSVDEIIKKMHPELFLSSSMHGNTEINNSLANKGDAILALGQKLGIKPDEIMAFGDSANDYTMIKSVGFGVAMANGSDQIKSAAKYVTKSCDEAGIAYAINELVLND